MADTKMSEIIRASLEGIKEFTDVDAVVGNAITTPGGLTVIPVSRIAVGFATGGVDFVNRKMLSPANFGGGGGTGVSVTPVAFLTVDKNSNVKLIHLQEEPLTTVDRALSLLEHTPELMRKIKEMFS